MEWNDKTVTHLKKKKHFTEQCPLIVTFSYSAEHLNKLLDFTWFLQDHMLISTVQNVSFWGSVVGICTLDLFSQAAIE